MATKTTKISADKAATLRPMATALKTALKNLDRAEGKLVDARLIAAVKAAEIKAACKSEKVPFKRACEKFSISYHTTRVLAKIGEAELAETGAGLAMLNEMRERNAFYQKRPTGEAKPRGEAKPLDLDKVIKGIHKIAENVDRAAAERMIREIASVQGIKVTIRK